MKILNRWTNACIWEGEAETMRDAVRIALGSGADLRSVRIKSLQVFTGLYEYQVWAVVAEDGNPWVRMGCQFRPLFEWDEIGGIRNSCSIEFPNDGSPRCERRARAFEYAKTEALEMAKEASDAQD